MSDELVIPGSEGFCSFVEAYFSDKNLTRDDRSRGGHTVYHVPGHPQNIAVPKGRERLARTTFVDLLRDMGLESADYRKLAGTPAQLKAYCKQQRRR